VVKAGAQPFRSLHDANRWRLRRTLNPQQEAVALWKYLESRGMNPSINQVGRALHTLGIKWRRQDLYAWLRPFRERSVSQVGNSESLTPEQPGNNSGTAFARAVIVPLLSNSDDSVPSSSGVAPQQPAVKATKAERESRDRALPFDRPVLDCRNAILRAVWERVQPLVARSTTFTDWRKRNAVIAASFALGGFTPDQIVYAWEQCRTRDGDPVRELFMVQKWLERVQAVKARQEAQA